MRGALRTEGGALGFIKFLQFFLQQFEVVYETLRNFKRNPYFSKGRRLPPVLKDVNVRVLAMITLTLAASRVERRLSRLRVVFLSG